MVCHDPSRDDMLTFLATVPFASEYDELDREEAIYWFANDWHGGQSSNLYSALSTSEFHPSPIAQGPEESAKMLCEYLETEFCSSVKA